MNRHLYCILFDGTVSKSKKALHAIYLIRKYFSKNELLKIITSNYYSIMYYISEIWHLPTNTHHSKTLLMSASAAPLKLCTPQYDQSISYKSLHTLNNRATPNQMMHYKHAIQLFKLYNSENENNDWLDLFFNQNFNSRNNKVNFVDSSVYKIGKNTLTNRLHLLNNKIPYEWLNLSLETYKIKCKSLFMSNNDNITANQ